MTRDVTRDAFLGGKLHLMQPKSGYRAGVDAVLLAASVPARSGESVLDLGCGVGAVALCLKARIGELELTGVELQAGYAELARENGGPEFEVITADISDLPLHLRERQFDHVLVNPPYYDRRASKPASDQERETALGETVALDDWVKTAIKRVAPKGYVHMIHRAPRLPEILATMLGRLGSIEVLPLAPREGRGAELVIVRGRKNGRGDFRLHASLVLHQGAKHGADGDSYVPSVKAVLRDGAPLPFGA